MTRTKKRPNQHEVKGSGKKKTRNDASWVAKVSAAFQSEDWDSVLELLAGMRRSGEVPKLGTVQRWVRLADLCGDEGRAAALLSAVLRLIPSSGGPMAMVQQSGNGKKSKVQRDAGIRRHPPWVVPLNPTQRAAGAAPGHAAAHIPVPPCEGSDSGGSVDYKDAFTLVPQDASTLPKQRPPNWSELKIYTAAPDTIKFEPDPQVVRVDVPFVPGAFVMTGLLSRAECQQLIAATESIGYAWDVDYTFNPSNPDSAAAADPSADDQHAATTDTSDERQGAAAPAQDQPTVVNQPSEDASSQPPDQSQHPLLSAARTAAGGDRAAGCVWLADGTLIDRLFQRAKRHLPAKLCGCSLAGLNARLRFYRYDSGNVYRPHVDGAWPGSGISPDGKLVHDAYGDRWSRLTFLVYLNDDFEGGSTTFFTPAPDNPLALDARGVQPRAGNVLCFPHGDTAGSLVHEGSAVLKGSKYVIRTDVLYMLA